MAVARQEEIRWGSDFEGKVRICRDRLSRTEKIIAEYMMEHEEEAGDMSIQALAENIGTGVASIVRFSKTLGYQSFSDMKYQIRQDRQNRKTTDVGVRKNDDADVVRQKVHSFIDASLRKCLQELDSGTLETVAECCLNAGRLYIFGSGTASAVAQTAAAQFLNIGIPAYSISDNMLHLRSVAFLEPKDVLIAINYSGYSKDIGDSLYFAKKNGATTVLLTAGKNTLLSGYADHILYLLTRNTENSVNVAAGSICQIAILEIIQALIQQKRAPGKTMEWRKRVKNHTVNTYYDVKQERIYEGRVRLARKEAEQLSDSFPDHLSMV